MTNQQIIRRIIAKQKAEAIKLPNRKYSFTKPIEKEVPMGYINSFNAEDYYGPQRWNHFIYKDDDDGRTYCETSKLEVCESGTPRYEVDYNDDGEPIVTRVGEDDTLWIDPVSKRTFHDNEVSYSSDPFDKPMVYQKEDVIDEGDELPLYDVPSTAYDAISSGEGVAYEPATHMTTEELRVNGYRNWKVKDIIFTAIRYSRKRAIEKVLQELEKPNNCLREEDKDYLRDILKDKDIELPGRIKRLLIVAKRMVADHPVSMNHKQVDEISNSLNAKAELRDKPRANKPGVYTSNIINHGVPTLHMRYLMPKEGMKEGEAISWIEGKDFKVNLENLILGLGADRAKRQLRKKLNEVQKTYGRVNLHLVDLSNCVNWRNTREAWSKDVQAWINKYEGSN